MTRAICDVEYGGFAATRARRFARDTIRAWQLSAIGVEAEMVTTELVTNAVLHGAPPISLELDHYGDVLRISVSDHSAGSPVVVSHAGADAMTGRGLALVGSLSTKWGVLPAGTGRTGKLVWAELATVELPAELPRPRTEAVARRSSAVRAWSVQTGAQTDADQVDPADTIIDLRGAGFTAASSLELLLEHWDDTPQASAPAERQFSVVLKDVPVDLLFAVEAHVDNVVRELTLASYESAANEFGHGQGLHGPLAELLREVVAAFGDVRQEMKRQAATASDQGAARADLSLSVPASMIDAGERYLAALREVDEFARAERLLTAESPAEHRMFRSWCVGSLIAQLRACVDGSAPNPPQPFERFLLDEVARLASVQPKTESAEWLTRLHAAGLELAQCLDVSSICRTALQQSMAAAEATAGAIAGALYLAVGDGDFRIAEATDAQNRGLRLSGGNDLPVAEVYRSGRPLQSVDDQGNAVASLPLQVASGVGGVLSLTLARALERDELVVLTALAEVSAQALAHAQAVEQAAAVEERTNHTRLDLALAAASIGSFDWSLTSGTLSADERMCDIFGIDEAEFDGRVETLTALIVPADRPMVERAIERAISRLGDFSVEFCVHRPDGRVCWIDCRGRVLPRHDGDAGRVIGVAFDSTELREARDRVARTLEHMGDAFFSLDPQWRVTYVNAAGERILGRDRASLLGQALWAQFPGAVGGLFDHECRLALETRQSLGFERYIEATGQHFEVRVHPIPEGLGVYFTDISQIRRFEREQAELRAASQHARSEAEMARRRLSFIADVAADMTLTLVPDEVCRRLASHVVGRLADWVSIYLLEGHECVRVAATHRDARWKGVVAQLVNAFPIDISADSHVARAIRSRRPVVEQHVVEEMLLAAYPDPEASALIKGIGMASLLVAPMVVRDEVLGAIVFVRSEPGNEFELEDVRLTVTLASRAALAVQNAQLYARQSTVVETLQQAVLPERLPSIRGVELAARYEPARGGAGVGGDFYDVFHLPSGRIALAVGDAAGHGLHAGALMGQLRNALRAYAVQERGPLVTLHALSDLIAGLEPDAFATAFYAELDPQTGEFTWANAGHPPPLLALAGEPSRYLEGPTSPPLGIFSDFDTVGGSLVLPPGGGVLIYTDGLIERRHVDISEGLAALQVLVDKTSVGSRSIDSLVEGMRDETEFSDDVCVLLAVRSLDL